MGKCRTIGIDGSVLRRPITGIGRYCINLFQQLDNRCRDVEFIVYSRQPVEMPALSDRWKLCIEPNQILSRLPRFVWTRYFLSRLTKRHELDLFWCTNTLIPCYLGTREILLTVYDLNYWYARETMNTAVKLSHKLYFEKDVKSATRILTISQGTARKISKHFGKEADMVIHPSVSPVFTKRPQNAVSRTLQKYGIRENYILSTGTLEPRKNIKTLIKAFRLLNSELRNHDLVVTGLKGWKFDTGEFAGVEYLKFIGYVPDEELADLYSGAAVFVFPSIYEGYGIPVAEAIACGTRVIASDIEELREAGKGNAIYTKPTSSDIANNIMAVLQSEQKISNC